MSYLLELFTIGTFAPCALGALSSKAGILTGFHRAVPKATPRSLVPGVRESGVWGEDNRAGPQPPPSVLFPPCSCHTEFLPHSSHHAPHLQGSPPPSQSSKLLLILQSPGEVSPLLGHLPSVQSALIIMTFTGFYCNHLCLPLSSEPQKQAFVFPIVSEALSKSLALALAPYIFIT